jgi:hypothetical protein
MNFNQNPDADVNGTSYHDVQIQMKFDWLVALLGKPHRENDCEDKVQYEWFFTSEDGQPVTLYDWKSNSTNPNIWNVGGHSYKITSQFRDWLYQLK